MKKIISPLCSALVVPGLGQVLNQDLRKGLTIMAGVFIIFITGVVKLAYISNNILSNHSIDNLNSKVIFENISDQNQIFIWLIFLSFTIIWIYSVVDAFWTGKKIDKETKG